MGWAAFPGLAAADDPFDPEMQTEEARERDRAMIRKLNRDMLAQVQARDARYAEGWRAYRAAPAEADRYARRLAAWQRDTESYAEDRRRYEAAMSRWRRAAAACRADNRAACD